MTDRELLELAAKAMELENPRWDEEKCCMAYGKGDKVCYFWNPLSYDEDVFRLAVKLRIDVDHVLLENGSSYVLVEQKNYNKTHNSVRCTDKNFNEQDRLEITRRAIVRVAAEIGKRQNDLIHEKNKQRCT